MTRILVVAILAFLCATIACARKTAPRVTPRGEVIARPALLPLPARVEWQEGGFTLSPETVMYDEDTAIGLTWAGAVSLERAYDWDPVIAAAVPSASVLGVEAPLWTETAASINDVEFLAFPRLAAFAELAWTVQTAREWDDFRDRLAAQAPRWVALGINFYRSPEIQWRER